MPMRLVLGWSPVVRAVIDQAAREEIYVIGDHPGVDRATDHGILGVRADPTNQTVLEDIHTQVTSVLICPQRPQQAITIARTVDRIFPETPTVAAPTQLSAKLRSHLSEYVDTVIDASSVVGERFYGASEGTPAEPAARVRRTLLDLDGNLAIVTHANPDPDAIASALGLATLAGSYNCPATIYYSGTITHQENRAMVNLLDIDLNELSLDAVSQAAGIALVDHGRPGANDSLPRDLTVDIVIDHHPERGPTTGRVVDRRSDVGATSTILTQYFSRLSVSLPTQVATALLYGIRTDTDDFRRSTSSADLEATKLLYERADHGILDRIESPTISPETFETIAAAIANRRQHGSILISNVGELTDRDALAQSADRLLELRGVNTTLVCGLQDGMIYCSARSRGTEFDLGEVLHRAFSAVGAAGGHNNMAGAQIEAGVLLAEGDNTQHDIITDIVADRFFETLTATTATQFPESQRDRHTA